jgi:hypothetical protein
VLDCLIATGLKKFDFILDSREKVENLPPVTHPHGTCKDCKFWTTDRAGSYCGNLCVAFSKDFYCADFVKRGVEDGSN